MVWAHDHNGLPLFTTGAGMEWLQFNDVTGNIVNQASNKYALQDDNTLQLTKGRLKTSLE